MASKDQMPAEQTQEGARLHRTRNNQNGRGVSVALLEARIADGIDMALITKQAPLEPEGAPVHWRAPDAGQVPR